MELEELKRKLMGLWEKTTHNSKDLVATLFEYYFDKDLIEYKEVDGKVVSALFGIPYKFGYKKNYLTGLYLISLSSEEGFRKKGVLAELLNNFNNRVKDIYDFTFLVPHTELLADYFGTQGYLSSFFILEERYTPLHDFRNDYLLSISDSDEKIRILKEGLLDQIFVCYNNGDSGFSKEQIIEFIESVESKSSSSIGIIHSGIDLEYILQDQNIRNLMSYISYDSDHRITGVAFAQKDELKRIKIVATFIGDPCSYYALLDFIKYQFNDYSISVIISDPKYQSHSLYQSNYVSSNPAGGDLDTTVSGVEIPFNMNKLLQPQGMVRLLRFDRILQYLAASRSDVDFKLYIRDYLPSDTHEDLLKENGEKTSEITSKGYLIFNIKNGKCKIERKDKLPDDNQILNLTQKEISELLLRKNDTTNLIMEAFGIPRLNLQMYLLPY